MSLDQKIKQNPKIGYFLVGIFIFIISVVGFVLYHQINPVVKQPEVAVVEFADGQNKVIVNRNGQVTINTPYGTFTQTWDPQKIQSFFDNFNKLNFDNLSQYLGGDLTFSLTFNNGKKINLVIDEVPDSIMDYLQNLLEDTYSKENLLPVHDDIYLGLIDQVDNSDDSDSGNSSVDSDDGDNGDNDNSSNDPWGGNDTPEEVDEFNCEYTDQITGKRVVISNTVCMQ